MGQSHEIAMFILCTQSVKVHDPVLWLIIETWGLFFPYGGLPIYTTPPIPLLPPPPPMQAKEMKGFGTATKRILLASLLGILCTQYSQVAALYSLPAFPSQSGF
jgi:hypothetical protein